MNNQNINNNQNNSQNMNNQSALIRKNCNVTYQSEDGQVQLDIDIVRNVIAKGNNISDMEIYSFVKLCQYQKLNPFLGEAHLIKYGDSAQMVVGIDVFTNRLDEHPKCEGWTAGLILLKDNNVTERTGTFYLKNHGEEIVGAWFKARRSDWKSEFEWSVTFSEFYKEYYDKKSQKTKPLKNWAEMPATMIVKCVIASGARKLFTKDFKGVYAKEEIGVETNPGAETNPNLENVIDVPLNDNNLNNKIDKNDIDNIYKAMKSYILKLSGEDEYKIIEYVIKKLIQQGKLKEKTVLSNVPKDKLTFLIEGVKKTILLYERKELDKKSNVKSNIIEMEYTDKDNDKEYTDKTDKDNDNKKNNDNKKETKKKEEKKEEKSNKNEKEEKKEEKTNEKATS